MLVSKDSRNTKTPAYPACSITNPRSRTQIHLTRMPIAEVSGDANLHDNSGGDHVFTQDSMCPATSEPWHSLFHFLMSLFLPGYSATKMLMKQLVLAMIISSTYEQTGLTKDMEFVYSEASGRQRDIAELTTAIAPWEASKPEQGDEDYHLWMRKREELKSLLVLGRTKYVESYNERYPFMERSNVTFSAVT